MPHTIKVMTTKVAKQHRPDAYYAVKGCSGCGCDLRIRIRGHKYRCPCRISYVNKNPNPAI